MAAEIDRVDDDTSDVFQSTPGINTGRILAATLPTHSKWFQSTPGINTGRIRCSCLFLRVC